MKTKTMKTTTESGYIRHIRTKADAGKPWAEKAMGDAFYFGMDNMKSDLKNAFEWYRKAAGQGDSSAMHAVGRAFYFGEGEKESKKKAAEWYRKAADAGDAGALSSAKSLSSLARMYQHGIGVKQNLPEAEKLYLKAINEHNHTDSFYPLARLYLKNPELEASARDILRLLILAKREDDNKAAEYDIHCYSHLLGDVSPVEEKQILKTIYDDLEEDWSSRTQDDISGISEKMAVDESPFKSLSADEVYNRVWRSVVRIETDDGKGKAGSGVIVQPDVVATNHHVVEDAVEISVYQPKERSGQKERPYPARVPPVQADGGEDYCLLHVPELLLGSGVPATIRRYDTLKIGETVYALGAPDGEVLSLSKGIISQLRVHPSEGLVIQSDVSSARGSSGGGLFDSAGNLIGHTTFGSTNEEGVDVDGLGFFIPADLVLEFDSECE